MTLFIFWQKARSKKRLPYCLKHCSKTLTSKFQGFWLYCRSLAQNWPKFCKCWTLPAFNSCVESGEEHADGPSWFLSGKMPLHPFPLHGQEFALCFSRRAKYLMDYTDCASFMHIEEVCLGQGCWWGGMWEVGFATANVKRDLQFPGLLVTLLSIALKYIRKVR